MKNPTTTELLQMSELTFDTLVGDTLDEIEELEAKLDELDGDWNPSRCAVNVAARLAEATEFARVLKMVDGLRQN